MSKEELELKKILLEVLKSGNQLYDDYTIEDLDKLQPWELSQINTAVQQVQKLFIPNKA